MRPKYTQEEKQAIIERYLVAHEPVIHFAADTGVACGTIYAWIEKRRLLEQPERLRKYIDLSALPRKPYEDTMYIEWSKAIGYRIPFVYAHISGELTITEHHRGNYIVILYNGRSKRMRTNALMEMKISDLFTPEERRRLNPNRKAHENFVKEVKALYHDEYTEMSEYAGNKKPIQIRHNSRCCGYKIFSPTPNNFLRGSGCPYCSSTCSFPEVCIMMVVSGYFPDAQKKRIDRRGCDIVFTGGEKRIGIQYDGSFYHQDRDADESFNCSFLMEEGSYLIRIREEGCPELKEGKRVFYISAPGKYTPENMQQLLEALFDRINLLAGTDIWPQMTKELWLEAKRSFKLYHANLLAEEYAAFLDAHGALPSKEEQNYLHRRMCTAFQDRRFSEEALALIHAARARNGLLKEEKRDPDVIFRDLQAFCGENGYLPRQQNGDAAEHKLYLEVKRCIGNGTFSPVQMAEYERLRSVSPNVPISPEVLLEEYTRFCLDHHRLPNSTGNPMERSLAGKVARRLQRGTFTEEQREKVMELRRRFSRSCKRLRIIEEYQAFIQSHGRVPGCRAGDAETALYHSMQYYLRKGVFSEAEQRMIAEMQAMPVED